MLPVGVLIPTRNSLALLPEHLASLAPWLAQAAEVVVVDSESADGTVEYLRANLRHPRLRFLDHPPGLYPSWNFGLGQIQSPFAYISAVGDSLTGEGLAHLHEVAERLCCDVVVSKPRFVDAAGQPLPAPRWPIDDICETLALREPAVLTGVEAFLFAIVNPNAALLGSSASNLYRTEFLRTRPFPADFGTAGDGAWGRLYALDLRLGVTPRNFSTFREHPKTYNVRDYAVPDLAGRLHRLAIATLSERRRAEPDLDQRARESGLDAVVGGLEKLRAAQQSLDECRQASLPWVLNPRAWSARRQRARAAELVQRLKRECLKQLRLIF